MSESRRVTDRKKIEETEEGSNLASRSSFSPHFSRPDNDHTSSRAGCCRWCWWANKTAINSYWGGGSQPACSSQ